MRRTTFSVVAWFQLLVSCDTLPNGRGWGEDVTLAPGWDRVGQSLVNAATDPFTWAPAAGALILQIDDWDENLADWGADETPIFGSEERASDFRSISGTFNYIAYYGTALATPSGDEFSEWVPNKVKGLAVGISAQVLTMGATQGLKSLVGRERPEDAGEQEDTSFPSEHASRISAGLTLASRNLDSLPISNTVKTVTRIGFGGVTAVAAWSRVEARDHFPSDVLAGIALGHFIASFINDTFMGLDSDMAVEVSMVDGFQVGLGIRF